MSEALTTIENFDENSLPDLDVVTLAALELFEKTNPPVLNVNRFRHPLILGSGNAIVAARAIFSHTQAVFADESNYESAVFAGKTDGAYIFSASGSKHAVTFAKDIGEYEAYYFLLPEKCSSIASMFVTKFDELFGSKLLGRAFTFEQSKHAKTVISNEKELFISFGKENTTFGHNRLHIPLPDNADYAAMMAIGYFVVGYIQKNKPPYFKDSIGAYMQEASKLFGNELTVIVE